MDIEEKRLFIMKRAEFFLGIDGGGTKTAFALADKNGNVLREAVKRASNPIDLGIEKCKEVLHEGIEEVTKGIPYEKISVFAGMSGGSTGDNKRLIGEFLADYGFLKHGNGSDAENAVAAGLNGKNGVVVITGTGCCAFASLGGKLKRFGGLGWLFDRYGGGYDYGNSAIRAALMAEDGTGKPTLLRKYILEKTGHKTVFEDLAYFYTIKKNGIASYAPAVFKAYADGDEVATEIMEQTAEYLAGLIVSACSATEKIDGAYKIVFVGGLTRDFALTKPLIVKYLEKTAGGEVFDISVCEKSAVTGALLRAGLKKVEGELI